MEDKVVPTIEQHFGDLSDPRIDPFKVQKLAKDYAHLQVLLEDRIHKWSEISGRVHHE